MMNNFGYYIACLVLLIVGFLIFKKVAGCVIKTIITLVLVVLLAAIYYFYLR